MADVFVSYSKKNVILARQLVEYLEVNLGLKVWWDHQAVGGSEFREEIKRQLALSKAVLVLWTSDSVESIWVQEEADEARRQNKYIPLYDKSINPGTAIPIGLRSSHAIKNSESEKISDALAWLIDKPNSSYSRNEIFPTSRLFFGISVALVLAIPVVISRLFFPHIAVYFFWITSALTATYIFWPNTRKLKKLSHAERVFPIKRLSLQLRYLENMFMCVVLFLLTIFSPLLVSSLFESISIEGGQIEGPLLSPVGAKIRETMRGVLGIIFIVMPIYLAWALVALHRQSKNSFWDYIEVDEVRGRLNLPVSLREAHNFAKRDFRIIYGTLVYPFVVTLLFLLSGSYGNIYNFGIVFCIQINIVTFLFLFSHVALKDITVM